MELIGTRATARRILRQITPPVRKLLMYSALCLIFAYFVAFVPEYSGLSDAGHRALFILVLSAGLWITEAMPAFSVSLLAIGLSIAMLGQDAAGKPDWEKYIATWGSPLIWLFFGGFVLAAAASKTGLDVWMAGQAVKRLGSRPAVVLMGIMGATALLSMFLSNTATATIMVAILTPMLWGDEQNRPKARALLLGVTLASNLGGMGTIIGTPPNAIAAGALARANDVNFAEWMVFGIPPALVLLGISWGYLVMRYLGRGAFTSSPEFALSATRARPNTHYAQTLLVVITFFTTVILWLTSPWHGLPTTVVSLIPICVLTTTLVLDADDVKGLPWDVLLLIAGGLSLGVAVNDSGLAKWIVAQIPLSGLSVFAVALVMAYGCAFLANLMSHTAASNVIIPLALALLGTEYSRYVIPIAIAASCGMCLPVSTPPNAIVYGTRQLDSRDLLVVGLLIGLLGPVIAVGWTSIAMEWGW